MITELPLLPHFIWTQIIKYAIPEDREDLCLVSKAWFINFTPYNGRILNYNINTGRCYESLPWSKKIVREIAFTKFTKIDWGYIYKFKNIKSITIELDISTTRFDRDFVPRLLQVQGIQALMLDIDNSGFSRLGKLSFLKEMKHQLRELKITGYCKVVLAEFHDIIDQVLFPKLLSFANTYEGNNLPFKKILLSMPNLTKLHLDVFVTDQDDIIFDYPISRLKQLSIIAFGQLISYQFHLDLSKYPSLKKLEVYGDLKLINSKDILFETKVEDLKLHNSTIQLAKTVCSTFKKLKYFELNCSTISTEVMFEFFNLCDRLKVLILDDFDSENLPSSLPLVPSTLASLNIRGANFLTLNFLDWLTNNRLLRYLKLSISYHEKELAYREISSENLEELYLFIGTQEQMSKLKKIFSPEKFPNLKNCSFTEEENYDVS